MEDERIMSQHSSEREIKSEVFLRPRSFSEYIGQKKVVQNVELMVQSAKIRSQAMDHCLFSGPPGLGKTSLAMILAKEIGSELHVISGPALEKKGDLASILTNLAPGDVLFIDEIHRIHISIEELLYSAMEDFRLDIILGQGAAARTMQIDLVPFTLVGATTRSGLLSTPLRDRFMASLHFDFYETSEISAIVKNNATKLNMAIDQKALELIALSSRGTPRIANRILRRVRDYTVVKNEKEVSFFSVKEALKLMEIDQLGLDWMDRRILSVIQEYYGGGPVGIEALCATLAEDRTTIEDVYEPFLLKEGLLLRTPRGREISSKAQDHLADFKEME